MASGLPRASSEVDVRLGFAAFERGDYAEAIQCWKRARRAITSPGLLPALAEAHFRRALAVTIPMRQVAELQEAIAVAPNRVSYHLHLGLTLQRQDQLRRAIGAYEAALRLAPGDERVRFQLALALLADPSSSDRGQALLAEPAVKGSAHGEAIARLRALASLQHDTPREALTILSTLKSPSPLAILALGLTQLASGQSEAARANLAKVLRRRQPTSAGAKPAAALGLAAAHRRDRLLDEALKALAPARGALAPTDPRLRRQLTSLLRRLGGDLVLDDRVDDAIDVWEEVARLQSGHATTQRLLSHLHDVAGTRAARAGHFGVAAQHWQATLAGHPGDQRVLRNLALAEERLERWADASGHWEELIRLWRKPAKASLPPGEIDDARARLSIAYRHVAKAHEAAGNLHEAAHAIERALVADPSNVELRLHAAELYLENEEYGGAIEQLRRVREARPNDIRVLLDLGSAYDLKGDDRQAQSYLEQALALEPGNRPVRSTLASVHHDRAHRLIDQKQGERAVAEFERAVELVPTDPTHHECLGALLLQLGRIDAAEPILRQALALAPGDAQSRIRLAEIYRTYGQVNRAEQLLKEAVRLDPSPSTRATIGVLFARRGDLDRALVYFKYVLKTGGPALLSMIGNNLITDGRSSDAIPYLQRAVKLEPWDAEHHLNLAYAYAVGLHDHRRAADEITQAERLVEASGPGNLRKLVAAARQTNARLAQEAEIANAQVGRR